MCPLDAVTVKFDLVGGEKRNDVAEGAANAASLVVENFSEVDSLNTDPPTNFL